MTKASSDSRGKPSENARWRWRGERVVEVVCNNRWCRRKYLEYTARANRASRHFCSRKCYSASISGRGNPNYKHGATTKKCHECKRKFSDNGSVKQKFCSPMCRQRSSRKKFSITDARKLLSNFRSSNMTFAMFAKSIGFSEGGLRSKISRVCPDLLWASTELSRVKFNDGYRKGHEFECRVRKDMMRRGYVCMMSPRSSGRADLMAAKGGVIILVECKLYGQVSTAEKIGLLKLAAQAGGIPVIAKVTQGRIRYLRLNAKLTTLREIDL